MQAETIIEAGLAAQGNLDNPSDWFVIIGLHSYRALPGHLYDAARCCTCVPSQLTIPPCVIVTPDGMEQADD